MDSVPNDFMSISCEPLNEEVLFSIYTANQVANHESLHMSQSLLIVRSCICSMDLHTFCWHYVMLLHTLGKEMLECYIT